MVWLASWKTFDDLLKFDLQALKLDCVPFPGVPYPRSRSSHHWQDWTVWLSSVGGGGVPHSPHKLDGGASPAESEKLGLSGRAKADKAASASHGSYAENENSQTKRSTETH